MTIKYRFLEMTVDSKRFVGGIAYTGYFDDSEKPSYVSRKVTKERYLNNTLEELKPEDVSGINPEDQIYEWSPVFKVEVPDVPRGWDPESKMEERDRFLRLSKTA